MRATGITVFATVVTAVAWMAIGPDTAIGGRDDEITLVGSYAGTTGRRLETYIVEKGIAQAKIAAHARSRPYVDKHYSGTWYYGNDAGGVPDPSSGTTLGEAMQLVTDADAPQPMLVHWRLGGRETMVVPEP